MVGFPSLYSIEPEESIGNDARLLIIDLAQGYFFGPNKKEPEEVRKGLKEIRKDKKENKSKKRERKSFSSIP